jgi:hypothetical protein
MLRLNLATWVKGDKCLTVSADDSTKDDPATKVGEGNTNATHLIWYRGERCILRMPEVIESHMEYYNKNGVKEVGKSSWQNQTDLTLLAETIFQQKFYFIVRNYVETNPAPLLSHVFIPEVIQCGIYDKTGTYCQLLENCGNILGKMPGLTDVQTLRLVLIHIFAMLMVVDETMQLVHGDLHFANICYKDTPTTLQYMGRKIEIPFSLYLIDFGRTCVHLESGQVMFTVDTQPFNDFLESTYKAGIRRIEDVKFMISRQFQWHSRSMDMCRAIQRLFAGYPAMLRFINEIDQGKPPAIFDKNEDVNVYMADAVADFFCEDDPMKEYMDTYKKYDISQIIIEPREYDADLDPAKLMEYLLRGLPVLPAISEGRIRTPRPKKLVLVL